MLLGQRDDLYLGSIEQLVIRYEDDWDTDPVVFAGVYGGMDQDGDPADNYSGTEVFELRF